MGLNAYIARAGSWLKSKIADWIFPDTERSPQFSFIDNVDDRFRVARYANYRKLFIGQQQEVFIGQIIERLGKKSLYAWVLYTSYNLPSLISRKFADLTVGVPPEFSYEDASQQAEIDALLKASRFWRDLYSIVCSLSYKGDAVLLPVIRDGQVRVKAMRPESWFPTFDGDGNMDTCGFTWFERHKIGADWSQFIREELHRPGAIENRMWKVSGNGQDKGGEVSVSQFHKGLEPIQETGVSEILPVHFPNYKIDDDYYGISDYQDITPLLEALSSRLTQALRVLDKHSDPTLFAPIDAFEKDAKTDKIRFRYDGSPVVPVDADRTREQWGYLTWDGSLANGFSAMDKLVDAICEISEMSPRLLGRNQGAQAESAEKMRLSLINTIAKVQRKQGLLNDGFRELFRKAFMFGRAWGILSGDPDAELSVDWKDALPEDRLYAAQVESIRTGGRATSSVESAVKRLDGPAGLDEELERLKGDKPKIEIPAGFGEEDGNGEDAPAEGFGENARG